MTPEAINMAMAELDGWEHLRYAGCGQPVLWGFKRQADSPAVWSAGCVGDMRVPRSYTEDLNAVAQVEERIEALGLTIEYVNDLRDHSIPGKTLSRYGLVHASAPRRCRALLRVTGKWVDT